MGNTPVTIGLSTNKTTCRAGETLQGKVYLSVNNQAQAASAIMLSIFGREHAVVHYTTEDTERRGRTEHTHTRDHYDESNNEFLQLQYPLQTFPTQQVAVGQYEFPFSIQMPTNLPSTMQCGTGQSRCSVSYQLTATLVRPSRGLFQQNPKADQTLIIQSVPPPTECVENTSLHLPMEEIPVNTCCCRNKGYMALQAKFEKTVIQPQDSIGVQFRCQNHSTVKVRKVRIQMEQVVEWKARTGNREKVRKTLYRQELAGSQFPELAKLRRKHRRYSGSLAEQAPFQNGDHWNSATIRVPMDIKDSYQGRSITVRHVASVQLITAGCCSTDPDAATLIQVYRHVPTTHDHVHTSDNPSAPSSLYDEYDSSTAIAESSSDPTIFAPSAPPSSWDIGTPLVPLSTNGGGNSSSNNSTIWNSTTMPSAPSEYYDSVDATATAVMPPPMAPMAEAQVLPPDWNAETAEVVDIPMAEAFVLDTTPSSRLHYK